MKSNCYICREYEADCGERHAGKDLVRAKRLGDSFYWGPKVALARGRWVKLCRWCVEATQEGGDVETLSKFFAR